MEEMAHEALELAKISVLGEYEVGLAMQLILTNDGNSFTPENLSASSNQG